MKPMVYNYSRCDTFLNNWQHIDILACIIYNNYILAFRHNLTTVVTVYNLAACNLGPYIISLFSRNTFFYYINTAHNLAVKIKIRS